MCHDFRGGSGYGNRFSQTSVVSSKLRAPTGVVYTRHKFVAIKWLRDVLKRTQLHRIDGVCNLALAGNNQYASIVIMFFNELQTIQPGFIGHLQVEYGHRDFCGHQLRRFTTILRTDDFETSGLQVMAQHSQRDGIVIRNQNLVLR